jgi:hypothetical protein
MVSESKLRHPNASSPDGKFDLVTPVRVFRLRILGTDQRETQSWVDAVQEAATRERMAKQAARESFRQMSDVGDLPLAEGMCLLLCTSIVGLIVCVYVCMDGWMDVSMYPCMSVCLIGDEVTCAYRLLASRQSKLCAGVYDTV